MGLNVEMVTFDCRDPARLAGWWAEQFGGTTHDILAGEFTAVSFPRGCGWGFRRCPIPRPGRTACTSISVSPISTPRCRG